MELVFAQDAWSGWRGALEPWLEERQRRNSLEPVVLVVPNDIVGGRIKEACLRGGGAFAGLRICTPSALRKILRDEGEDGSPTTALREDLHLLMQLAAQELSQTGSSQKEAHSHASALLAPARYVQIYDLLSQARIDIQRLPEGFLKSLLLTFEAFLEKSGLTTLQQREWALTEAAERTPSPKHPAFWLYGFSAADYAKWPLLYAALERTQPSAARVCLFATGDDLWDSLWVEQWEDFLQKNFLWLDPAPAGPFAGHIDSLETQSPRDILKIHCPSAESQAWAIVVQVAQWLGGEKSCAQPLKGACHEGHPTEFGTHEEDPCDERLEKGVPKCARLEGAPSKRAHFTGQGARPLPPEAHIGIIFPKNSPTLARVSQYLSAYGLKHHDAVGFPQTQSSSYDLLKSYLAWQKEPRLTYFEVFLKKLHVHGCLGLEDFNGLLKALRKRFTTTLVEALAVLLKTSSPLLEGLLADWPLLPESAPLGLLGKTVQGVLERLELPTARLSWIFEKDMQGQVCARSRFAAWIEGIFYTPGRAARGLGQDPLSPLQLIPWERVCGQVFSHVLIADATHSAWEVPALPLLEALFPKNPDSPAAGELPLLTPAHTAALQAATLEHLVRSTTEALAVSFYESNAQGQPEQLHPFFKHCRTVGVQAAALPNLAQVLDPVATEAIQRAQAGRRAPAGPENPFQYCTGKPLILSAKDWEGTWRDPEQVFFEKILKAPQPLRPELEDPSRLAVGTWVHALVAQAIGNGRLEPEAVMKRFEKALELSFLNAPGSPRSLWELYFNQAHALATALLKKLLEHREGHWALVERALPDPTHVRIPGTDIRMPLTGRMDLVLSQKPLPSSLQHLNPDQAYEVIDFKTGGDEPLSLKGLEKGLGLQVVLYGLALQAHGAARDIDLLLLRPYDPWPAGLPLQHTFELEALWQKLLERHRFGCLLA